MIRRWQQYSCNNSSAYRLVARFADATQAATAAAALTATFREEHSQRTNLEALARTYGFAWEDDGWGSEQDGPHVVTDHATLIVFHDYCVGLGPGVPAFLAEHGGQVGKEDWAALHVSVLFAPSPDPRLDGELAAIFAQQTAQRSDAPLAAPWVTAAARGVIACYRDAGVVGMFLPSHARDLAGLRGWLGERGIERCVLQIETYEDRDLFVALAAARCTACGGGLEYLDPRLHDIETPQLVCRPCGGLYEVATFLEPA